MKKRKLFTAILSMLLIVTMLSGCSVPDLPFLNKGNDDQQQDVPSDGPVQQGKISTIEGLTFHVGDTITFDDLASMSEEDNGNALQKVIMQSDGSTVESYQLNDVGIFSVVVAVQFLDGSSESAECTIEVLEKESNLPEALSNNIASKEWTVTNVAAYTGMNGDFNFASDVMSDKAPVISHVNGLDYSMYMDPSVLQAVSGTSMTFSYMPADFYNSIVSTSNNVFKYDLSTARAMEIVAMIVNSMVEEGSEEAQPIKNMTGWYAQLLTEITSASVQATEFYLYDVDGNQYQVMQVLYTLDASAYGGSVYTYAGPSYVDYNDGKLMVSITNDEAISISPDTEVSGEGENQPAIPATYDEFKQFMTSTMTAEDWAVMESAPAFDSISSVLNDLQNIIILGDVTPLLPVAPPDAEIVADPSTEPEPEASGTVADVFVPYSQQHPDIYLWPNNDTKYSRWVYVIDKSTQFVSSIINPDGTTVISGADGNDDWRLQYGQEGQQTTEPSTGMTNVEKATLKSSYASYEVSTAGWAGSEIDEEQSTSGRAVIKKGTETFYIETARVSKVQSYMSDCLFDNTKYKDSYFRVVEAEKYSANDGLITMYNIQYTPKDKEHRTDGYMAVYNINNDYLICYGDAPQSDLDRLKDILVDMVKVQ